MALCSLYQQGQSSPAGTEDRQMTEYRVTLRFQFPAWNEKSGIPFLVHARNKSEAIKYAKRQAERDGHIGGHAAGSGRASFKAEVV